MKQQEYPKSDMPDKVELRLGEEGRVESIGEAQEKAFQVHELIRP